MRESVQKEMLSKVIERLEESYLYSNLYTKNRNLYKYIIEAAEKPLIERVLIKTEGNQLKAAKVLGINRNTLRSKIKKLGIKIR